MLLIAWMQLPVISLSRNCMTFSQAKGKVLLPPVTGFSFMISEMLLIATVVKVARRLIILMPSDRWLAPSLPDVVDVSPNFFDELQTAQMRSSIVVNESYNIMG